MIGNPPSWQPDAGEDVALEMACAWRRGERLHAEEYLQRYPALTQSPQAAVRVIFEEVCLRQEFGEEVEPDEILGRFPSWREELALMLDCQSLVQLNFPAPTFPEVGELLGGFRLIDELGRGTLGRVYLATQPTLADRPVVLKVTPRCPKEFLSLARLQHTHIIPLHGVHDFPALDLQALCQPYHGGTTLARLNDLMRNFPPDLRTGRLLVRTLDETAVNSAVRLPPQKGPRDLLVQLPYAEVIAWIGACLADALGYAHERGLVHLDVKPANVLLAADGQPLLLDFHLAHHPLPAGQIPAEGVGGTPEFMSPEQREAYDAALRRVPLRDAVDNRSDVYSLGRTLYALLGGKEAGGEVKYLRHCNALVSVGLADIVHRCIAADPEDRYPSMGALAEDLRQHLANRPLSGVANRSLSERWQKWRQRKPYAALWLSVLLMGAAIACFVVNSVVENRREADAALKEGQSHFDRGAYSEALQALGKARSRANGSLQPEEMLQRIDVEERRVQRALAAEKLHLLADKLRQATSADELTPEEARALEDLRRSALQLRTQFGKGAGSR